MVIGCMILYEIVILMNLFDSLSYFLVIFWFLLKFYCIISWFELLNCNFDELIW